LRTDEGSRDGLARFVSDGAGHRQAAIEDDAARRFPAALDAELAARERRAIWFVIRVIDLEADFVLGDWHTVVAPAPVCVARRSGATVDLTHVSRALLELDPGSNCHARDRLSRSIDNDSAH